MLSDLAGGEYDGRLVPGAVAEFCSRPFGLRSATSAARRMRESRRQCGTRGVSIERHRVSLTDPIARSTPPSTIRGRVAANQCRRDRFESSLSDVRRKRSGNEADTRRTQSERGRDFRRARKPRTFSKPDTDRYPDTQGLPLRQHVSSTLFVFVNRTCEEYPYRSTCARSQRSTLQAVRAGRRTEGTNPNCSGTARLACSPRSSRRDRWCERARRIRKRSDVRQPSHPQS